MEFLSDAEDGSGDKFRDGASTYIHEDGDEERRDMNSFSVAVYGGVQGGGEDIDTGGVSDECECRPRCYMMV